MEDVIRSRPTLLFFIVLALLFLVMSRSSQTRYVGETRTMFERTVMTIFSPVPKTVNWLGRSTSDMYHGYLDMRRSVNENMELRRKVADLTTRNLKLSQSESDVRRLRTLLGYSEQIDMPTTLATAIMLDTSGRFKSIVIDRGSDTGIEVNDAESFFVRLLNVMPIGWNPCGVLILALHGQPAARRLESPLPIRAPDQLLATSRCHRCLEQNFFALLVPQPVIGHADDDVR